MYLINVRVHYLTFFLKKYLKEKSKEENHVPLEIGPSSNGLG
jgi:hypothetical protein